jgi:hypothetical protein
MSKEVEFIWKDGGFLGDNKPTYALYNRSSGKLRVKRWSIGYGEQAVVYMGNIWLLIVRYPPPQSELSDEMIIDLVHAHYAGKT